MTYLISQELLGGKLTLSQRKQISELNKSKPFTNIDELKANTAAWETFFNDSYAENSVSLEFSSKT